MARRSQVPKFGNWESEENVPYTTHFTNVTKARADEKMNWNDSEENTDKFHNRKVSSQAPDGHEAEPKGQKEPEVASSKQERRTSREDGEIRRLTDSRLHADAEKTANALGNQHCSDEKFGSSKSESEAPKASSALRKQHERQLSREGMTVNSTLHHDTAGGRATVDSPHHRHGSTSAGGTPRRAPRQGGSDRSIEHSPLHPHHQAKVGGKSSGFSSPSWERKGSSDSGHGLGLSTPGRSRLRSAARDDAPDESPAVPKFGEWDENDPAAAEVYTHIFNQVRAEKQVGTGKVPIMPTEISYTNGQKRHGNDDLKSCRCFSWCGK